MVQNLDGGNIHKFEAIRQNFTIQNFSPAAICMQG